MFINFDSQKKFANVSDIKGFGDFDNKGLLNHYA